MNLEDLQKFLAGLLAILSVIATFIHDDVLMGIYMMSLAIFNLVGSMSCNKTENGKGT